MRLLLSAWLVFFTGGALAADLPVDTLGKVQTLPHPYPQHWLWVQDITFDHMAEGRVYLVNPRGENIKEQVKGMFNAASIAGFAQSTTRPEVYVSETFYERLNRGKRSDVITVYDRKTLAPVAEIPLPAKRASVMPGRHALHLTADDSLLLVYFFTPATSIGVVDVAKRKFVGEIALPSCALAYPTGKRGFSALCGNGAIISVQLNADGTAAATHAPPPFFDVDGDALMEKPVVIGGMAYFPTFQGNMQEIDLRGDKAVVGRKWNLVPEADRAQHWRPGGALPVTSDDAGRLYVLMHPDGREGTHKEGGPEVWVYDVAKQARVQRIVLKDWGISIEATRGRNPQLVVTNANMALDVYDAASGAHVRTLATTMETPVLLHAAR